MYRSKMRHVSRRWGDGLRAVMTLWAVSAVPVTKFITSTSSHIKQCRCATDGRSMKSVDSSLACCNMKTQLACQEYEPHTDTNSQFFILTRVVWLLFFCLLGKACWGWLEMYHLYLSEVTFFIVQPFQKRQGSPQGWRKLQKWMDLFSVKTVTAMVP